MIINAVGDVLLVGSTTSLKSSKKMEDCEHQQRRGRLNAVGDAMLKHQQRRE